MASRGLSGLIESVGGLRAALVSHWKDSRNRPIHSMSTASAAP